MCYVEGARKFICTKFFNFQNLQRAVVEKDLHEITRKLVKFCGRCTKINPHEICLRENRYDLSRINASFLIFLFSLMFMELGAKTINKIMKVQRNFETSIEEC